MDVKQLKKIEGKILFIDIETSNMLVKTFMIGTKVHLRHSQIVEPSKIICICYQDMAWKEPKALTWDKNQCDKKMLIEFCKIAEKYEYLVGHNGDNFDIKFIKGRLYLNKLPPLTNIKSMDTLKMSRKTFRLPSQRLDYHSKSKGYMGKMPMCEEDWYKVEAGDKKALQKMVKYCIMDVKILKGVFLDILPYVDRLPFHMGLMLNDNVFSCPKCASENYIRWGSVTVNKNRIQKWKCKEPGCGYAWNQGKL